MDRLRRLIVCVALVTLPFSASALDVPGLIATDTTWLEANSPYVVTGNIVVNSGVALTIEPGVEVRLDPGISIQVRGALVARGTEADHITFTANVADSNWGYLLFDNGSVAAEYDVDGNYVDGSILEYVVVEYGGGADVSNNAAVRVESASPYINHSAIRYSKSNGIYAHGGGGGVLRITNTEVSENQGTGLYADAYSAVEILHNTFRANTRYGADLEDYRVELTASWNIFEQNALTGVRASPYFSDTQTNITNNLIRQNGTVAGFNGGGILVSRAGSVVRNNIVVDNMDYYVAGASFQQNSTVEHNLFIRNASVNSVGGLQTWSSTVRFNVIADNVSSWDSGSEQYVGGVRLSGGTFENNLLSGNEGSQWGGLSSGSSSATVSNNTFAYNRSRMHGALDVTSGAVFNDRSSTALYSGNNFFGNLARYGFVNNRPESETDIIATGNWWGSADDADIQFRIYDYFDDATRSIVHYTPQLTAINELAPISPPTGLTVTPGVGTIDLAWNANPEGDLAGYKVYWGIDDAPYYENVVDVGHVTAYTLEGLAEGAWFVGVTAYDTTYDPEAELASTLTNDNMTAGNESWFARAVANPMTVSTTDYDFGEVYTGASAQQALTISNAGFSHVTIIDVSLAGVDAADFAIGIDGCSETTLAAGESCTFTAIFSPVLAGARSASIVIGNDADQSLDIALTATAVATGRIELSEAAPDFGSLVLGASTSSQMTISNVGTATLNIDAVTVTGSDAGEFSVMHSCGAVGASQGCPLTLGFTPTTAGSKSATLTIDSNDPYEPSSVVALTGVAVTPVSIAYVGVDAATGMAPLATAFTVTAVGGNGSYAYHWDFGDGVTSTAQNPDHTFTSTGTYTVAVTLTDANDDSNMSRSEIAVVVVDEPAAYAPVGIMGLSADISSGVAPLDISFDVFPNGGSGSYTYSWDFGDGATGSTQAPAHTFASAGNYAVQVTVTDANDAGNSATGQLSVVVVEAPVAYSPVAISGLTASKVVGIAPLAVDFTLTPSGGSGHYTYSWDFGDASSSETLQNPGHLFSDTGVFTVTVTVSDSGDAANSATGELTIITTEAPVPYDPVVINALTASQVAATAPMAVDFALIAAGGSGNYSYDWNFGDGQLASGANPTHTFTAAGTYAVTVTVTDLQDGNNVASGNLTILAVEEPVNLGVAVEVSSSSGTAPHPVTLTATMTGGSGPYTVTWDFGDGTSETLSTSTDTARVSHTYQNAGTYEIGVTVVGQGAVGTQRTAVEALTSITVEDAFVESADSSGGGGGGSPGPWLLLGLLLPLTLTARKRRFG